MEKPVFDFSIEHSGLTAAQAKRRLRQALLKERNARSREEGRAVSQTVCERLAALPCLQNCSLLLLYYPTGSEIDLLPLADFAAARGIPVGFPVCRSNPKTLVFRKATPKAPFVSGAFGIPVPPENAPVLAPDDRAVCILPALGYDPTFTRIGYGGGYYDRFLQTFPGLAVGVCAEAFLCRTVFSEPHDRAVDLLVTEKRTIANQNPDRSKRLSNFEI